VSRSLVEDNRQIGRAIELIGMGARLQVLQSETDLPYERLLKLYKEVTGKSPSRGQLPFSTDWFLAWQPNVHASLFLNIYEYLNKTTAIDEMDAIVKAYRLYRTEVRSCGLEPMMSITRSWRLVRFVNNGMLCMTSCTRCKGRFVNHTYELTRQYTCVLCSPPGKSGRSRRQSGIH
jgi:flagellar transcriptional activator FlhC